jgi:hypothetical protein
MSTEMARSISTLADSILSPIQSRSSRFFRNNKRRFVLDPQENLRTSTRPTGSIVVDFDNDGDLDLYVSIAICWLCTGPEAASGV